MLRIPRFSREDVNPRFTAEAEIGALFQQFAWEVLLRDFPDLRNFAGSGRDGAIDQSATYGNLRTVIECKFLGEDGLPRALKAWREVAAHLSENLADPAGPPPGQSQYGPWYSREPGIHEYWFCVSSNLGVQGNQDSLRSEIAAFFRDLARSRAHLAHLGDLDVAVLDWGAFETRLQNRRTLAFRWFPGALLAGFAPLDDVRPAGRFRVYLSPEKLPYYSRARHHGTRVAAHGFFAEEDLVDGLRPGERDGIIISGPGGAGKTRLTLELGRIAQERGWYALRVKSRLRTEDLDVLAQNAGEEPILLLIDYLETQRGFPDFVERLRDLHDELGTHLAYIANCRNSYYPSVATTARHTLVEIGREPGEGAGPLQPSFESGLVRHIFTTFGMEGTAEQIAVAGHNPILAVFLATLHVEGKWEDLRALLDEGDFATWIRKRIELSFAGAVGLELEHDLALLFALFPLTDDAYQRLYESPSGKLLRRLEVDGWVEPAKADLGEGALWATLHDVFADRVALRYLGTDRAGAVAFVKELFRKAVDLGCLRSALISMQRLAIWPEVVAMGWFQIFEREMAASPEDWKPVRNLLASIPLLSPPDCIRLLGCSPAVWEGAEEEVELQNRIGWLARWLRSEEGRPVAPELAPVLKPFLLLACRHVTTSNFVLTQALEFSPEDVRDVALRWLTEHPVLFQSHYVMVAWLDARLGPDQIRSCVESWLGRYGSSVWNATFVYRAWLEAGGPLASVREKLLAWLERHGEMPEADFVYCAWLDAGGEVAPVREKLLAWLERHGETPDAQFAYRAWLDAGGEVVPVREKLLAWLEQHGETPEARFVYSAWLNAGGEVAPVREKLLAWVERHGETPEAGFVYRGWLEAGSEVAPVRGKLLAWVERYGETPDAWFVYCAWLEAGGEVAAVQEKVLAWAERYGETLEAQFVYPAWLRAGGEVALVREKLLAWVERHGETPEATFVYRGWLDAGGDVAPVREKLLEWLEQHGETPEARFVCCAWLDSTKDIATIRKQVGRWLARFNSDDEVDHLCRSWMHAGGEFAFVRGAALAWFETHWSQERAVFLLKEITRQPELPLTTVRAALQWCRMYADNEDSIWRLSRLWRYVFSAEVAAEFVGAVEAVLESVFNSRSVRAAQVANVVLVNACRVEQFQSRGQRHQVLRLFARAVRDGRLFAGHGPVPELEQHTACFEALVDALDAGYLHPSDDEDSLRRFLRWVNGWPPKRKGKLRPLHALLTERFPACPQIWSILEFPPDEVM
jgi:hypothetical protein